ncbi:MAG: hypothetical protein OYG31_02345 [Candidatus Kaiserbacteria bacterium]|nr:hypothetical protein [Candidatus Kaiserbacteria bacterium]
MLEVWLERITLVVAVVVVVFVAVIVVNKSTGFDVREFARDQWDDWRHPDPPVLRPVSSRVIDADMRGLGNTAAEPHHFSAIMLVRSGDMHDLVDMLATLQQGWSSPANETAPARK